MPRDFKPIPLVGNITEQSSGSVLTSVQKGQFFQNAVFNVIKNPVTGGGLIRVRPMQSTSQGAGPAAASTVGSAIMNWTGQGSGTAIVTAFGSPNSTLYVDSSSTGAVTGKVLWLSETAISGTANFVAVTDSGRTWFYPDAGALTEITDADFPPKQATPLTITGNFVHLDGYAIVMCTNGQVWNSDLNSMANWTATSYITASALPDGGVGVVPYKNYVAAFGKNSCQFAQNAGNATGSPLNWIPNAAFKIGALNQYCILNIRDTVAFVGISAENSVGVYVLKGFAPDKISNAEVDDVISRYATTDIRLHQYVDEGQQMLLVQLGTGGTGFLVYDFGTGIWSQAVFTSGLIQTAVAPVSGVWSTVFIFSSGSSYYKRQSGSGYMELTVVAGPISVGGNKAQMLRFGLDADGLGSGTSLPCYVSFCDAYESSVTGPFSTERTIDLGSKNPILYRCGGGWRRRFVKIRWTPPTSEFRWLHSMLVDLMPFEL